jgi:hypothetical protein
MSKHLPPGDPQLEELRQQMRGEYLLEHVKTLLQDWPPLSNDQLDKVAGLLLSARTSDGAA